MLNPCDYSDVCILLNEAITVTGARGDVTARQTDERSEQVTFKNVAPFNYCIL